MDIGLKDCKSNIDKSSGLELLRFKNSSADLGEYSGSAFLNDKIMSEKKNNQTTDSSFNYKSSLPNKEGTEKSMVKNTLTVSKAPNVHKDVASQVREALVSYRVILLDKSKEIGTEDASNFIQISSRTTSIESIARVVHRMNHFENLYTEISLVKLEVKVVLDTLEVTKSYYKDLKDECIKVLGMCSELLNIVSSRKSYLADVLTSIRSINTNMRYGDIQATLKDRRGD